MKAVVLHEAGDLRIEEREENSPGPGEVKVRIAAGGVCGTDLHYYNHGGFGSVVLREPMILGHEVAGHVDAVGPGVEGLAPGDLVVLLGEQGNGAVSCEEMADRAETIPYEIMCGVGVRVPRIYLREGRVTHVRKL